MTTICSKVTGVEVTATFTDRSISVTGMDRSGHESRFGHEQTLLEQTVLLISVHILGHFTSSFIQIDFREGQRIQ